MKQCKRIGCQNQARIKFCSNKCKDRYHNVNNPRGKFKYLKNLPKPSELMIEKHWANGSDNENMYPSMGGEGLGQD